MYSEVRLRFWSRGHSARTCARTQASPLGPPTWPRLCRVLPHGKEEGLALLA